MKIEFIKRGAATRLILIFAGWSTDTRYYNDCVVDGWDAAVVSDYRNLTMPQIPAQYSTVYVFAYSLGVWAASVCNVPAAARIAICGSEIPISDEYGIPVSIFKATADGLTQASLKKFHLRMAGDKTTFNDIEIKLPEYPIIESLKEELYAIADQQNICKSGCSWDKVYIAKNDRIFPFSNIDRFWMSHAGAVKVVVDSSHAIDVAQIIKESVPDSEKIKAGFFKAISTYNDNAIVQSEICNRIGETICRLIKGKEHKLASVLEIGVGQGLLTDVWSKILAPSKATFVDLLQMPKFGIAEKEEYFLCDAEEWLKNSSVKYDVILSASTLQWFVDPIGFIQTVKEHLNPGGFAVISTFVKGNLHQLDSVRPCPLIYHSAEEYREFPGIKTEEWESTLKFSSARAMLLHLHHTGVTPRQQISSVRLSSLPTELTYRPLILVLTN